jgi:uroporphyrinogen decarboxylase
MRPAQWREFVAPYLGRLLARAHAHGLRTMLHSCGNVSDIVGDLMELGLDILHPVQPEAVNILELKGEFGRDLTFCGGISTQRLLPYGTPEEIRREVRRTIGVMSRGGGYITEPGITLQADVPTENLVAVIEAAREYRR